MTQIRNRAAVKIRHIEIATFALEDVELYAGRTVTFDVCHTWDGRDPEVPTFYVGMAVGPTEATGLGTPGISEDRWDLECSIVVPNCATGELAELAAEVALNAYETVLLRLSRLVDPLDQIVTADPPSPGVLAPWSVAWARIAEVTGPYHTFARPAGTGQITGVVDFTIAHMSPIR